MLSLLVYINYLVYKTFSQLTSVIQEDPYELTLQLSTSYFCQTKHHRRPSYYLPTFAIKEDRTSVESTHVCQTFSHTYSEINLEAYCFFSVMVPMLALIFTPTTYDMPFLDGGLFFLRIFEGIQRNSSSSKPQFNGKILLSDFYSHRFARLVQILRTLRPVPYNSSLHIL